VNPRSSWQDIGRYSTVGLEFALSILVGLFGGRWLDSKLDAGGWLTFVGLGFGLAAGIKSLLRALKEANRQAERLEREDREARAKYDDHSEPRA
jgi:ATP synthase protein I